MGWPAPSKQRAQALRKANVSHRTCFGKPDQAAPRVFLLCTEPAHRYRGGLSLAGLGTKRLHGKPFKATCRSRSGNKHRPQTTKVKRFAGTRHLGATKEGVLLGRKLFKMAIQRPARKEAQYYRRTYHFFEACRGGPRIQ